MQAEVPAVPVSRGAFWAGWTLSGLVGAFLLLDGVMKLAKPPFVVEGTVNVGYPESSIVGIGIALTLSTLVYLYSRTAVLGAILVTGYLGGAVATHVRIGHGAFEVLFPVVFGILVWAGLYLRDRRVRALVPLRS